MYELANVNGEGLVCTLGGLKVEERRQEKVMCATCEKVRKMCTQDMIKLLL